MKESKQKNLLFNLVIIKTADSVLNCWHNTLDTVF